MMKKCPKCKKYTMEETYGGLTGMIWYQTYECNKCKYNVEKNIKEWKHKFISEFSVINTINTPISF